MSPAATTLGVPATRPRNATSPERTNRRTKPAVRYVWGARGHSIKLLPQPSCSDGMSDGPHVLGLVPLAARANIKLDALPLLERAVAAALNV
jgi:hypothetical protein